MNSLENELDRSLELFRQLEFEMKLEEVVKELDGARETSQEKLKGRCIKKMEYRKKVKNEQEELNEEFDELAGTT